MKRTSPPRVFSGIQPSGVLHLGNYLGALRNWVELQREYECFYCIVDLHAITVRQDAKALRENIFSTAAVCLAAGVDPQKSALFVQSDVAEHSELAWILNCYAYLGELNRMTQFKDKARKGKENASLGLYGYPVLMAADILLYEAQAVPVGEDQRQHLELSRDLARRFNALYGDLFVVPEPIIPRQGARIMGLDDPTKKMSKSASSGYNYVSVEDPPAVVIRKFKSAATDSGREIKYDEKTKPGVSNLIHILAVATGQGIPQIEEKYAGKGYAQLKEDVGKAVAKQLAEVQERIGDWKNRQHQVRRILQDGAERARRIAGQTLKNVKAAVGLGGEGAG